MLIVTWQNHSMIWQKNCQSYDKVVIASLPQNIGFVQYLANIFQGRIEYELVYSLRGANDNK